MSNINKTIFPTATIIIANRGHLDLRAADLCDLIWHAVRWYDREIEETQADDTLRIAYLKYCREQARQIHNWGLGISDVGDKTEQPA